MRKCEGGDVKNVLCAGVCVDVDVEIGVSSVSVFSYVKCMVECFWGGKFGLNFHFIFSFVERISCVVSSLIFLYVSLVFCVQRR